MTSRATFNERQPNLRGFTRPNLFRMRQFYEAYRDGKKVSPLVRQLPWTHHLIILGRAKRPEEREFYVRLAVRERWTKRELERQLRAATFERAVLAPAKSVSRCWHKRIPRLSNSSRTPTWWSFSTCRDSTRRPTCIVGS